MKKINFSNAKVPTLGDVTRPSCTINQEIVSATDPITLGEMFENSYNARIGVLSRNSEELDRLNQIADKLLKLIPKEKMPYVNFIILDNELDLRNEVLATPDQLENKLTKEQMDKMRQSALLILTHSIQKGCIKYATFENKDWNKDELRNEMVKMKEHILRVGSHDASEINVRKPNKPLLFSKKNKDNDIKDFEPNLQIKPSQPDEKTKIMFTTPRAREDSLPSDLIKFVNPESLSEVTYSFLDLLAADGYETNDLENFEEEIIKKLDKLKTHILRQFNPVFNEMNVLRKRLNEVAKQSAERRDKKSIIK